MMIAVSLYTLQCPVLHQGHHGRVGLTDSHLLIHHVRLSTARLHLLLPAEGADIAGVPLHLVGVVVEGGHDGAGRRPAGGGGGGRFEGVVWLSRLRLHSGHLLHLRRVAATAGTEWAHRVPQPVRGRLETLGGRDRSVAIDLVLQAGPPSLPRPPPQAELAQLYRQSGAGARLQLRLGQALILVD